jgi:hypothetical protein
MIINNKKLTEKQFWRDPISTKEQAVEIVRRASRDLAVLSILGFLQGFAGPNISQIVCAAVQFVLCLFLARQSRLAAGLILASLIASCVILVIVAILGAIQVIPLTAVLPSLFAWPFAGIATWMIMRAYISTQKLHKQFNKELSGNPSPTAQQAP